MIWGIFKKDWLLLWPMVGLVAAIQAGLEWAVFSAGSFGASPAAQALLRPLTLAWFGAIAALAASTVHQDAIPGADQDWLIRPLKRTHLLLAKLAFLAMTVSIPMFAANLADAVASGFPLVSALETVLFKELFVLACFIVPVMAVAATTRNMTELVVVGAALVVVFASSLSMSAFIFGADWCPTCNSGVSWLQHVLQHLGVLIGAVAILGLQFYGRRSAVSRTLAIAGAMGLVFFQLPWSVAFAVQDRITGSDGNADRIMVGIDEATSSGPTGADATGTRPTRPLQALGRAGEAMQYFRQRARPDTATVAIDLPLRAIGTAGDELVLADRTEIALFDHDRLLYRGDTAGSLATLLTPFPGPSAEPAAPAYQTIEMPKREYIAAGAADTRMRLSYSLTLLRVAADYKLAALDGELQSADVGQCATSVDRNAVYLRCKTLAQAPFCFSATLYGPAGRHNPEVLKCTPDYRRGMPKFMEVLSYYGVDLPLQDRNRVAYEINRFELDAAYVLLKVYGVRKHFERALEFPGASIERWRAHSG